MKQLLCAFVLLAIFGMFSSSATATPYLEADFTYKTLGKTAWFQDESVGLEIVEWHWTFGDERNYSYEQDPIHTFAGYGTYNVTLTVINSYGVLHTAAHNIVLSPAPASPYLTAGFAIPLILVIAAVVVIAMARNDYVRLGGIVVLIMGVYFLVA